MSHSNAIAASESIDDFSRADGMSALGTPWRLVTDRVMGGVSDARMQRREIDDRQALCMEGGVSLENNGGFVQINLDLAPGGVLDASKFTGLRLVVRGNGERYNVHLKSIDISLPWQSYRAEFTAPNEWQEWRLPFDTFVPHRIEVGLDVQHLTRLGIVAIGRAFHAMVCVAEIGFYSER